MTWGRELATASPESPRPGNRELNSSSASWPDRDIWGSALGAGGLSVTLGAGAEVGGWVTTGALTLPTVSPAFKKPAGWMLARLAPGTGFTLGINLAENRLLSGTAKSPLLLPAEVCGSAGTEFVLDSSVSSCLVDLIGVARLSFFRSSCYNKINVIQGCAC